MVAASEDGQQYLVEWRLSGKQKWVSVLNILFEGETQEDLEARRAAAEGYRATQETAMLRNMLVQRMPRDGGAEMPAWLSDNIRRRIGRLAEGPKLSKFSTPDQCAPSTSSLSHAIPRAQHPFLCSCMDDTKMAKYAWVFMFKPLDNCSLMVLSMMVSL